MNDFKKIRFLIFFISTIICFTLATFNIFATNKRVDQLENKMKITKNVLCAMALDFKWKKTINACKE